jgi:hypothetical protein
VYEQIQHECKLIHFFNNHGVVGDENEEEVKGHNDERSTSDQSGEEDLTGGTQKSSIGVQHDRESKKMEGKVKAIETVGPFIIVTFNLFLIFITNYSMVIKEV